LKQSILERGYLTFPFLACSILFQTKFRNIIDIIVDLCLYVAIMIVAPEGTFSAISILYLFLFTIPNRKFYVFISFITFVSIGMNVVIHNFGAPYAFLIISLYTLMASKFYYKAIKPYQDALAIISQLKHRLSIMGPATPLTDDQILLRFEFLKYSGDNVYRKIRDLELLIDEEMGYKEIAAMNGISEQTQFREFKKIRADLGSDLGIKIRTAQGLARVCSDLGIIRRRYSQTQIIL
jgi:hypothetical protein